MHTNMNYKTQVVLDVLRRQIDLGYNFPTLLLRYDLDVFFFDKEGQTYPLPVLDNDDWPPLDSKCQLREFSSLLLTSTTTKLTEPANIYTEFSHGYRLTHIVAQFAKALMNFDEETVLNADDDVEYVQYEPDDIEGAIHQFAYFLASLTGATDTATVARFIMQLSLFKRCEPSFTPFAMPTLSRNPLIGRAVINWRSRPHLTPKEDLVLVFDIEGKTLRSLTDISDAIEKIRGIEFMIKVASSTIIPWTGNTGEGVRLSELVMMCQGNRLERWTENSALEGMIAAGLNSGSRYPVVDSFMVHKALGCYTSILSIFN